VGIVKAKAEPETSKDIAMCRWISELDRKTMPRKLDAGRQKSSR
jgi:hypothetical protein